MRSDVRSSSVALTPLRERRDAALKRALLGGMVCRVAVVAFGLINFTMSARELRPGELGVLVALSATSVIAMTADLGLGLGLVSKIAHLTGADDPGELRRSIGTGVTLLTVLGLLITTVGLVSATTLDWSAILGARTLPEHELTSAVAITSVATGLAITASVGQHILVGRQRGAEAFAWTLLESVATFLAIAACIRVDAGLPAFVAALIGTAPLVRCLQCLVVFVRDPTSRPAFAEVDPAAVKGLLRVSGLFFAIGLSATVFFQSGVPIVAHKLGAGQAAELAIVLKLFTAVSTTMSLSGRQFWPAATEAIARGDGEWVRRRFLRVLVMVVALTAVTAGGVAVIGGPIIEAWIGPELRPTGWLLAVGAVWTVYVVGMTQCSYLLHAVGILKAQLWMTLSMTVVTLTGSWFLTESWGIAGPMIAGLAAHVVCAGGWTVLLIRRQLASLGVQDSPSDDGSVASCA